MEGPNSGAMRAFLPGAPEFPVARRKVETTGNDVVGDAFPDSKPILGQRYALSDLPAVSKIPKAVRQKSDGAPVPVPTVPTTSSSDNTPQTLACTSDSIAASNNIANGPAAGALPEAHEDERWIFPSQQRFYNAMKKKGWNPREEDLPYIVSIHNTINENTWSKVAEYEEFHKDECPEPKLLRFQGLPTDYSLKARLKSYVGYVLPFDRHDWTVDRCGKDVRYIIDFYNGPEVPYRPVSVHLDVRPAPDSIGAVYDRVKMFCTKGWKEFFHMRD